MQRACRIVFVCTGNAGRSQIAAALCQQLGGSSVIVRSAGVEPWDHLHPVAVQLLTERGIDTSSLYTKPVSAILNQTTDIVVTIGDPAKNQLPRPMLGDPIILDWDISDPADADGTNKSEAVFRKTWEMIEVRLPALLAMATDLTRCSRAQGRLGIGTGIWYPERFEPAIHLPQAVAAGFVAIELNCFLGKSHFDYQSPEAVRELAKVADDLGIEVWSIHEPCGASMIGATDTALRQKALDEIKLTLDLAAQLGASDIPSHALLPQTNTKSDIAIDSLMDLVPAIQASGAKVAIENGQANTQDVLDLFAVLPKEAFGFVIDTGHANIAGGNDDIRLILDTAGDRMTSLHLNDNNAQQDSHHPPSQGTIDWASVAKQLRSCKYDGCLMWEVFAKLGNRTDDPIDIMNRTAAVSHKYFNA